MSDQSQKLLLERLEADGRASVVVVTGSMAPLLPVGTTAEAVSCRFEDLKRFDLILYRYGDKIICHAVWGRSTLKNARGEPTLLTWGLVNPAADDPVTAADVLGRLTSHRLTAVQVAWVVMTRLFSRSISGTIFYVLLMGLTLWFRLAGDSNVVFAICSAVGVFVFGQLLAHNSNVRGRLMALALALSPLSIYLAHLKHPWSAVEALTIFYIVALWNFTQGEKSRLTNTVLATIAFAAYLKFVPNHFAFAIPSPAHWSREDWNIVLNPVAIFCAVTLAAWAYRLLFRLTVLLSRPRR